MFVVLRELYHSGVERSRPTERYGNLNTSRASYECENVDGFLTSESFERNVNVVVAGKQARVTLICKIIDDYTRSRKVLVCCGYAERQAVFEKRGVICLLCLVVLRLGHKSELAFPFAEHRCAFKFGGNKECAIRLENTVITVGVKVCCVSDFIYIKSVLRARECYKRIPYGREFRVCVGVNLYLPFRLL